MGIDHAKAVRADQTNTAGSRRRADPILQRAPFIADFGKAPGEDHGSPGVGLRTLFDGMQNRVGWHCDEREVHWVGDIAYGRVDPTAQDLLLSGVNQTILR